VTALPGLALSLLLALPAPATTRAEKLERILALEDRRSAGGGELQRYLGDPDRSVRRRAALAAGRIADTGATPGLVTLLNDGEPEVRQMAAFALGLVGDRSAGERLVLALEDTDAVVRARAVEALGRLGDPARARAVAAMVLRALPEGAPVVAVRGDDAGSASDPWLELRLGLFALERLKDAAAAQSVLVSGGRSRFDWWAATWVAMRLAAPGLRPVLLAAAESDDPVSRGLAARGFANLKDASALELLGRLSKDRDEQVAVHAVRALGTIGDARGESTVADALLHASPFVRWEALKALALLPPDRELRGRILPFLADRRPYLRGAALPALARIDREEFSLILSTLDADPEWSVRASLAEALAEAGDEVSVGILLSMVKDPDPRVLPAVLAAVRKARKDDALPTLVQHLGHPDFAVRAAAAEGIAALEAQGQTAALLQAWERALPDRDLDARLSLVAALAAQQDAPARDGLRRIATEDPQRVVRARAAQALATLGEAAPGVGPERSARATLDDRAALGAYLAEDGPVYTPRAILHTSRGRIEIQLDVVETPLTSESFLRLARRGFYDGLVFHRVAPGFVIQGGDPRGDGNGGPGYTLRCEISQRPYGRGSVGMALSGKDTGGSQFFITHSAQPHLDGGFTAFGRVAAGMDVVDRIEPGDVIERVEVWDGR